MVKVIAQRSPIRPGVQAPNGDNGEWTFVFRSAVSGKLGSRGEGRSSLAIFNGANAIYRHSTSVVVVAFDSYVSDESGLL